MLQSQWHAATAGWKPIYNIRNAKVLHADLVVPVLKLRLVLFTLAAWSCGMNPLHAFNKVHPWIYDALAPVKEADLSQ